MIESSCHKRSIEESRRDALKQNQAWGVNFLLKNPNIGFVIGEGLSASCTRCVCEMAAEVGESSSHGTQSRICSLSRGVETRGVAREMLHP